MYLSFYELDKKPFQISSDPAFLWMSEKHKEALAMLKYGIMDNRGFIMLTGDVGTGKTTLLNALKETLGPDVITAGISNPGLEKLEFLNFLAASFGLEKTFRDKGEFILGFKDFLETCYRNGKKVLLIIDEAQQLAQEMLEEIRLLSNIEYQDTKLLNIFFAGQDELDSILDRHENRALRQRMTLNYHIEPLAENELGEFVEYRLKVAGARNRIFSRDAVREIYSYSKGYPRLVNIICDYAMLVGYAAGTKTIGADEIRECVIDLRLPKTGVPKPPPPLPASLPARIQKKPEAASPASGQKAPSLTPSIKDLNFDHLIGHQVGTATLLKELSRGGLAATFVAYQRSLKRRIAIKISLKSILTPSAAESFEKKAELASILSHPNIVPIHEIGETEDLLFFTMQMVNGKPLSDHLEFVRRRVLPSKRMLPLSEILTIMGSVLDALDYAHSQDVIHGDIKPADILIEALTDRPMITGFGAAPRSRGQTEISRLMPHLYMAPEQMMNKAVDGRADIYAAATILFEMLVPELPIPEVKTPKALFRLKCSLKDRFFGKRPSELNPKIDKEMDEILLKALSFYPENRYATGRAFLHDLERYRTRHLTN